MSFLHGENCWLGRTCLSPRVPAFEIQASTNLGGTTVKRLFGFLCARGSKSILNVTAAALGMMLCAALVMLAMPVASYGQDTGYISGTVTDKSGAAIANAEVTVTSTTGNLTR